MNLYVFRIAKGHDGGEPTNVCPISMKDAEFEIKAKLKKLMRILFLMNVIIILTTYIKNYGNVENFVRVGA